MASTYHGCYFTTAITINCQKAYNVTCLDFYSKQSGGKLVVDSENVVWFNVFCLWIFWKHTLGDLAKC